MTTLVALPTGYNAARQSMQVVATHVLARARFFATGRFGLRVTWHGIATPAFGAHTEVLRVSGTVLVRERQDDSGAHTYTLSLVGASLEDLATFAEIDLSAPFSAGRSAPAVGDPSEPIDIDPGAAAAVLTWFRLGASSIDQLLLRLVEPSIMQLWPEHFDVGLDALTPAGRVNLGASPGDATIDEPYLYVGPWEAVRPGDSEYWNAAFGAALKRADLMDMPDPLDAATSFFRKGLDLLS
jgi:hypothetical protein